MWSRLLTWMRGAPDADERERARRAFEATNPGLEATSFRLRAREAGRTVVAVIYRDPASREIRVGTPQYKLYALRGDLSAEELAVDRDSPYAIRGVK